jgi:hypothetical protein
MREVDIIHMKIPTRQADDADLGNPPSDNRFGSHQSSLLLLLLLLLLNVRKIRHLRIIFGHDQTALSWRKIVPLKTR